MTRQDSGGLCWLDGLYHRENHLPVDTGFFLSGIFVKEEIRARGTRLAFISEHYESLQSRLSILHINLSDILTPEELHRQAVNLINKNRYFGGNLLRITVFHDPGTGNNHCLLECRELEDPAYILNRKGLVLGLYDDLNIQVDRLTGKFDRSPLLDFFARRYMRARNLNDCILFNQQGHLTSSLFSAIFLRIRNQMHTPPVRDGSPSSVLKDRVIHILGAAGDAVNEDISLRPLDIEKADEILLVNTVEGIRWVVAVDKFRYYNRTGIELTALLNDNAFGQG